MSVARWESGLRYSILGVAATLLIVGFWRESVPPLTDAWNASDGSGALHLKGFLFGPAGYMVCLLLNALWFGLSASLAKTSGTFPRNFLDDSLVATQLTVLLVAAGLVASDGQFLSLGGPTGSQAAAWTGSFLLAGVVANGLALLDSHLHLVRRRADPTLALPLTWRWINGVTIMTFLIGAALAIGATLLGLQPTFDRWVGFGSMAALVTVVVAAVAKDGF